MRRLTSIREPLRAVGRAVLALTLSVSTSLAIPSQAFAESVAAPVTVEGRPEQNKLFLLPGHTYKLAATHLVDGRQGVAWAEDGYYVSGSNSLTHYGLDFKPIATNIDPLAEIPGSSNHLGDIDVYKGEIYASCEYFMDGVGSDIKIAVFGANDLKYRRSIEIAPESGQVEISGIAVDADNKSLWMCCWVDASDNYIYRYDLETGAYIGKYHLQAPPQWVQGVAYHDGWLYLTADDGTADQGEPDHVWRCRVDVDATSWLCTLERTLDDVNLQGEIEGITFDESTNQMLICYNHGAQIVEGMVRGFYDGFTEEIHSVYSYDMTQTTEPVDYSLDESWLSLPTTLDKKYDTFFILPCVHMQMTSPTNEDVFNLRNNLRCLKTFNMEAGIASDTTNVFCPLTRQKKLACFMDADGKISVETDRLASDTSQDNLAYQDVRDAFKNFMESRSRRPFIIFGFSHGADMALRLVSEFGGSEAFKDRHIATYAIGAYVTEGYLANHPNVKMAQHATDTGVVITYNAFDARAPKATGAKQVAINPLNWETDSSHATALENQGFVTVDTYGKVTAEQANYCGAHLDETSGRLIIDNPKDNTLWDNTGSPFAQGDYHLADLNLFYRNLQSNVAARANSFKPAA